MLIELQTKLDKLPPEEVERLKLAALEYLQDHPFDTPGCAESLGVSLFLVKELQAVFPFDFLILEEDFLSRCEGVIADYALGRIPKDSIEPTQISTAKWVLERKRMSWAPRQKLINESERLPTPNGKGAELVMKYLDGTYKPEVPLRLEDNEHVRRGGWDGEEKPVSGRGHKNKRGNYDAEVNTTLRTTTNGN